MAISAIILAGGKATRMGGVDKGLLLFFGRPLINHVIDQIKPQVDEILINANREISTYQSLGYPVLQDKTDHYAGPLAGVLVGLEYCSNEYLLCVPCDVPFLPANLAEKLLETLMTNKVDIAIASKSNKDQPVIFLCRKHLLDSLQSFIQQGGRKVSEWQRSLRHSHVDFSSDALAFSNINTPQELNVLENKLSAKKIPVIGICAAGSNSGKTTLIEKLIPELQQHGVRVSVIKHAHHKFDIDYPGKDSYKIRSAGAVQTLVASSNRWALITEMQRIPEAKKAPRLNDLIAMLNPDYADLILVEGFKDAEIPKIEVYRPSLELPALHATDPLIMAVATDAPSKIDARCSVLDLNNTQQIVDFILRTVIKNDSSQLI